jgi:hypothetical protein
MRSILAHRTMLVVPGDDHAMQVSRTTRAAEWLRRVPESVNEMIAKDRGPGEGVKTAA